jgi:hypothetical protein
LWTLHEITSRIDACAAITSFFCYANVFSYFLLLSKPTIAIQPPQAETRSGSNVLGPSALPSSVLPTQNITKPRRHKVVVPSAPSINDPAFPVQIQEELLNQVRYWTSQAEMKEKLNQEYDTKISEQERIIDALNKQRRMREESDGELFFF